MELADNGDKYAKEHLTEELMEPIDPNKPIQTIAKPRTGNDHAKAGKSSFDAVFKQQMDAIHAQPSRPESLPLSSGIHPAQLKADPKPCVETVLDKIQTLVDTMTVYSDKLAERGATLKDVEPIISKLESQSKTLSNISQAAGGKDTKLQEMIDQTLLLSKLEISRYHNGYYNDA